MSEVLDMRLSNKTSEFPVFLDTTVKIFHKEDKLDLITRLSSVIGLIKVRKWQILKPKGLKLGLLTHFDLKSIIWPIDKPSIKVSEELF